MENKNCDIKCPVQATLNVVGGKWKTIIIWHLRDHKKRFAELGRAIGAITQKMLTQQLKELEEDGIINRKVYPQVPPKVEYSLTNYGRTLEPVIIAMCEWGGKHSKRK